MAFQNFIHTYNLIQQWCLVNHFAYFDFLVEPTIITWLILCDASHQLSLTQFD
jgi:hypothetical protein